MEINNLEAFTICETLKEGKGQLKHFSINIMENKKEKKVILRASIKKENERLILWSKPLEVEKLEYLTTLCESVREKYENENTEEDDNLPF